MAAEQRSWLRRPFEYWVSDSIARNTFYHHDAERD